MVALRVAAIGLAAGLWGCAASAPMVAPQPVVARVPVPEPIYCSVPRLKLPRLPIAELRPESRPAETVRYYAATVAILKGAVLERDAILASCTAPKDSEE